MFKIVDEVAAECEWDTFIVGYICNKRATKVIVDEEEFHLAHLCVDHIDRAFEITTNGEDTSHVPNPYF